MATIESRITSESGIPLGGLGTGSVEIRPDGYFHEWQIFNLGKWAPRQPPEYQFTVPELSPGTLSFFVWTRQGRKPPIMRRLGMRTDQENLYSFAWLKSVERITFTGRFPVATLDYHDPDLPVAVQATMFAPFIPNDPRTSGTPGFYAIFTVRNRGREPVQVSLLGALKNFLAWSVSERRLRNRVTRERGTAFLTMRTEVEQQPGCHPTVGSLCLAVAGGRPSWITGEYGGFTSGYAVTHWGHPQSTYGMAHESWLHDFRAAGELPSLDGEVAPTTLLPRTDAEIEALSDEQCRKLLQELLRYPFVVSLQRCLVRCGKRSDSPHEIRTFLKEVGYRFDLLAGRDRRGQDWGDGALCATVRLRPGETREVRFTFSWHFPWHYSARGAVLGHMYENWFPDAEAVNRFLCRNATRLVVTTHACADTLYRTTLDPVLADAWSAQLSTLVKSTWWIRDGSFGVWEGLGCCGFHTTDITYQGSFSLLALFPELQKRQMEMGARFQRGDGRVHHFFTPDLAAVDEGFDRVDMNPQFVLLVARDYLWTGDRAYLERLWPHVVRAMDNTAQLDADGDGLPDHDTKRNTYDAWDFYGTPAYIASLWLAALRAATRLARDRGETERAAAWQTTLERGLQSFERKLWNGEYYSLWVDGAVRDECCMTDQLDGEWFTQLVGLGHGLPAARIVAALRAVLKYNFRADDGLINASYPAHAAPRLSTLQNLQAMAPWTGIEYSMASMMMEFGLAREGLQVVRNIHNRYLRAGRFWNHVECGDHYYRAMSSWAVLLSATGFKLDVPQQTVTVMPAFPSRRLVAPWFAPTGWGTFGCTSQGFTLDCCAGRLSFRRLRLRLRTNRVAVRLGGQSIPASVTSDGQLKVLEFSRVVTVRPGTRLVLRGR